MKLSNIASSNYCSSLILIKFKTQNKNLKDLKIYINDTLTVLGHEKKIFPIFASCSILNPEAGSFERFIIQSNWSKKFPTAISIVSPNIQ